MRKSITLKNILFEHRVLLMFSSNIRLQLTASLLYPPCQLLVRDLEVGCGAHQPMQGKKTLKSLRSVMITNKNVYKY